MEKRRLDKIYLDTTFAYGRNNSVRFPSKAEGISELLKSVCAHPNDTVFHFHAWTFGYEDVFVALSAALDSKVSSPPYFGPPRLSLARYTWTSISYGSTKQQPKLHKAAFLASMHWPCAGTLREIMSN